MNKLQQELMASMRNNRSDSDGRLEASFVFNEGFSGFQGHFPGNPVVPGVCLLQAVCVMAEDFYKTNVLTKEVTMAKFFLPIKPREEIVVMSVFENINGREFLCRAKVTCDDKKAALLELKLQLGEM